MTPSSFPPRPLRTTASGLLTVEQARARSVACILRSPTRCLAPIVNLALVFQDRKTKLGQDKTEKYKNRKALTAGFAKSRLPLPYCLRCPFLRIPVFRGVVSEVEAKGKAKCKTPSFNK